MNEFMKHYELVISTLSPVHIGCGEDYEPTNYVIEDGALYHFEPSSAMLPAADRKALIDLCDAPHVNLVQLRTYFRDRAKYFLPQTRRIIPVTEAIEEQHKDGFTNAQARIDAKRVVGRAFYNAHDGTPIIPGSSIKGAIRTAILNSLNHGLGKPREENNNSFQKRLLGGSFASDPLRLIKVADAPVAPSACPTHVRFNVALRRNPKPGSTRGATGEMFHTVETIEPGHRRATGQLAIQILPKDAQGKNVPIDSKRIMSFREIAQACNAFYRPQLEAELNLLEARGFGDARWIKGVRTALSNELGNRIKSGDAFLLRIGRHSGAEALTVDGVRWIKISKPGVKPARSTDNPANINLIWLCADTKNAQTNMLPMGWIVVEDASRAANASLYEWLDRAASNVDLDFHWNKVRAFQQLASEAKLQEAARAAAEREELKRAEQHQQLLSTLSPNMRRIEEFKADFATRVERIRGRLDKQNTLYHDKARSLAKDALEAPDWTADEKRAAADAIAEWLPRVVERIDKDQLKKLKLGALRGQS